MKKMPLDKKTINRLIFDGSISRKLPRKERIELRSIKVVFVELLQDYLLFEQGNKETWIDIHRTLRHFSQI